MKYMGSKNRIAKYILPIMLEAAELYGLKKWVEPMVGGGNIIDKVPSSFERFGYDVNPHVICALKAIRDSAEDLPESLTESMYRELKGLEPKPIISWLRFVSSFGGKFEAGYARQKGSDESTFAMYGKRNALKQSPLLQGVEFECASYKDLNFENCLIYCDPPYRGTSGYETEAFDHAHFFEWCRLQARRNIVFVSEYTAPSDFTVVWEGQIKTNFASQRTEATHTATEKLFHYFNPDFLL